MLYISNYGDINSGWAVAAQNNIRALNTFCEVVPRRIKYTQQQVPPDLLLMEERETKSKVCIQHVLPHQLMYDSDFYNIAYFVHETNSFGLTGWAQYLRLMDEIWVPSEFVRETCLRAGLNKVRVVPHCLDVQRIYQTKPFDLKEQVQEDFLFYTIADFNRRKNLPALLKAFHTEFNGEAGLVIKTTHNIKEMCEQIRAGLKKKCKTEILIDGFLSPEHIYSIHKSCDVFVNPSMGEAFSIPTLEALAAGKTPVCTNYSALNELVTPEEGWLVDYQLEPCFAATSLPEHCTSEEEWADISVPDLMRKMREAYESSRMKKSQNCMRKSLNYSIENVGKLMKSYLEDSNVC